MPASLAAFSLVNLVNNLLWASWAELSTNRLANEKPAWSSEGGPEIRTIWNWTSKFRSKMDLNRPELDKPPELDVQYEVVVVSGPK